MKKHSHAYGMVSVYCKRTRIVLTELGYLRKHIKTSICTLFWGTLSTHMGMFDDKQGDS